MSVHQTQSFTTMAKNLSLILWVIFPFVFLVMAVERLTETRTQKIRRLRRQGMSQRKISNMLGISVYKVRKALA